MIKIICVGKLKEDYLKDGIKAGEESRLSFGARGKLGKRI